VSNLTSEDEKTANDARAALEGMGEAVVPVLFDRLLAADWTLRPRLLEVLSAHGREFAKQKLLHGNDTEKVYAALVYELTRGGQPDDTETPEFKAMVEALLRAVKSDDKYLRAAAALALVHDDDIPLFFDHLHELIPVMISSFDTDLIIFHRAHADLNDVAFMGLCLHLDAFIGERPIYQDNEAALFSGLQRTGQGPIAMQRLMSELLRTKAGKIDEMRSYWSGWWKLHSSLRAVEIGRIMIERNLDLFEKLAPNGKPYSDVLVASMLAQWTGIDRGRDEAIEWWQTHRDSYAGPVDTSLGD
jgi:hypothetical protein